MSVWLLKITSVHLLRCHQDPSCTIKTTVTLLRLIRFNLTKAGLDLLDFIFCCNYFACIPILGVAETWSAFKIASATALLLSSEPCSYLTQLRRLPQSSSDAGSSAGRIAEQTPEDSLTLQQRRREDISFLALVDGVWSVLVALQWAVSHTRVQNFIHVIAYEWINWQMDYFPHIVTLLNCNCNLLPFLPSFSSDFQHFWWIWKIVLFLYKEKLVLRWNNGSVT